MIRFLIDAYTHPTELSPFGNINSLIPLNECIYKNAPTDLFDVF